ncbi:MAG TPA: AraC family transcriptional regulator, partial [Pseudomonas sp.]|nr:AraC family transcriptional regulator [Pseudomonas sp.]
MNKPDDDQPRFWRADALPFLEARAVADGRKVCYAAHCHETFSIGAITAGASTYFNGDARARISRGTLVLINPQTVHACNPIDGQPWSYLMFYVDAHWLGAL